MKCRRICRELLWLARFGEFGPSSAPHLEHLAGCRSCRDEVGFDRALVQQLRTALAARIEAADPSPRAWEGVLERMRQPEPWPARFRDWSRAFVGRLRTATAMAGTGLALLLALNLEVVPLMPLDDEAAIAAAAQSIASADGLRESGEVPPGAIAPKREAAAPQLSISAPAPRPQPDAEHALTRGPLSSGSVRSTTGEVNDAAPVLEAPRDSSGEWRALTVRVVPHADDAGPETTTTEPVEDPAPPVDSAPAPMPSRPGGPS